MALKTWQVIKRCSEGRYPIGKKFRCLSEDDVNYIQLIHSGLLWMSGNTFQINQHTIHYKWMPIKSR